MTTNINEIFPLNEQEYYYYDYQPIIDAFGKIIIQKDDDDYQGDSYIVYKFEDNRYGVLIFGWGSCSGCNALQACYGNRDEIQDLINSLYNSIIYFDSLKELKEWAESENRKYEYNWSMAGEFYKAIKEYEDVR